MQYDLLSLQLRDTLTQFKGEEEARGMIHTCCAVEMLWSSAVSCS